MHLFFSVMIVSGSAIVAIVGIFSVLSDLLAMNEGEAAPEKRQDLAAAQRRAIEKEASCES